MEILEERVICESPATVTKERLYLDLRGRKRSWSYIERRGAAQAVVIVARTRRAGSLLLLRQFRVPFGARLVELPAGLVDPGESPEEAARRELAEETGYSGEIVRIGPAVSSSAGITTETFRMVDMIVEEEPVAAPVRGGSEDIEVLLVPPDRALQTLQSFVRDEVLMDCKAYLALRGLAGA